MVITGDEILEAALETVTSAGRYRDLRHEADRLSRRSRFVIDSANLSADVLGRNELEYVVYPRTPDYFLWGPGVDVGPDSARPSNVRAELPIEVGYWKFALSGDVTEQTAEANGRLTPLRDWVRRDSQRNPGGYPRMLYWSRDLAANRRDIGDNPPTGTQVFRFWPASSGYRFIVYATVPAITEVRRGATYDLPQGVANYLVRLLAVDAQEMFGFPPRPELFGSLKSAAQGLSATDQTAVSRVTSPDWQALDGRFDITLRGGGSWY